MEPWYKVVGPRKGIAGGRLARPERIRGPSKSHYRIERDPNSFTGLLLHGVGRSRR